MDDSVNNMEPDSLMVVSATEDKEEEIVQAFENDAEEEEVELVDRQTSVDLSLASR